jgi:hypothetical protein
MVGENRYGRGEIYSEGEKIWWGRIDMVEEKRYGGGEKIWWRIKDIVEEKRYGREEDIWWKRKQNKDAGNTKVLKRTLVFGKK